jgi:multicomponent Na+:H+ antiporter subunit E
MKKIIARLFLTIQFGLFFILEIWIANFRVAYDVITPRFRAKPGVIAIPLDCKTDFEITLLALIISLTPGTLALDVSPDKKYIYLHAMFVTDRKKMISLLKKNFEKPLLRILR